MIDENLSSWVPCKEPNPDKLIGKNIILTAYKPEDAVGLWACFNETKFNDLAKFFPIPDFETLDQFSVWLNDAQNQWHTMVFRDPESSAISGMASYMRIDAKNGSCEVGSVAHAPLIQRSIATTEAHYLMAKYIFDELGYRRYEWKLHNDNAASHRAAKRFGFTFEGVFRNHIVAKGANRDTAWYAMINHDWPKLKSAFEAWLDPINFDSDGLQLKKLEEFRHDNEQTS